MERMTRATEMMKTQDGRKRGGSHGGKASLVHLLVLVLVLVLVRAFFFHARLHLAPEAADLIPANRKLAGEEAELLDERLVRLEREVLWDVVHDLAGCGKRLPDAEAEAWEVKREGGRSEVEKAE